MPVTVGLVESKRRATWADPKGRREADQTDHRDGPSAHQCHMSADCKDDRDVSDG